MAINKLGKRTDLRMAILRGQLTDFLWNGSIETTIDRAQSVARLAEKVLTLAVKTYKDTVEVEKPYVNEKGEKTTRKVLNDGVTKLNVRRKIIGMVNDVQEQRVEGEKKEDFKARTEDVAHPLLEKIFNVYAPKYGARAEELGQMGGYTRIIKLGKRRGDAAMLVKLELV